MKHNIDARGLACPLPVVNTKKELETMQAGETVEVLVDNEIAVQNLQKFAAQRNFSVKSEAVGEDFRVEITVTQQNPQAFEQTDEELLNCSCTPQKPLVVISGNTMGTGEEELGKALMKAFIFALTKQDSLPGTILFYNSGAFLSCEGSESVEDLKWMEQQGVEICTCGTCLNYYGLTEKLAVGSISNMYDIVEKMEQAKTIIRP